MTSYGERRTRRALVVLACLLCVGCVSRLQQARRFAALEPRDFVVVAPRAAQSWPCLARFVTWKQRAGFQVHHVWTSRADAPPLAQAQEVARGLRRISLPAGRSAYVLVIASPDTVTMGPWQVEGTAEPVHSDLPLPFADRLRGLAVRDEDWLPGTHTPRWILGRLPFDDEQLVAAALESAARGQARATQRDKVALLGAERFLVPCDASMVMAAVRGDLREAGWRATLLAQDLPRDAGIRGEPAVVEFRALSESEQTVHYEFLTRWAQESPDLVFVVTHAVGVRSGEEMAMVGAGRYALGPLSTLAYLQRGYRDVGAPRSPAAPAALVASACTLGRPDNPLLSFLFGAGLTSSICCSTATNGPLPPVAGIAAERDLAFYLSRGLSMGAAVAATRDAYLRSAPLDPLSWVLGPWVWPMSRVNAFSYTVYGDPSLQLVRDR